MWRLGLICALVATSTTMAWGKSPEFSIPVDCQLGETCYIQNYVDTLPAQGRVADFACGPLSYDGHKGTDFALHSEAQMAKGVAVIAAADGVVRGVRDEMPDTGLTPDTASALEGRECGNGIVIDHGDGWISQYCHLKRGSVSVQKGQGIKEGQPLGLIGFSGRTEFPHLHFAVRNHEQVIDPFDPGGTSACSIAENSLWKVPSPYQAGGLLDLGFASKVPDFSEVKAGTAHREKLTAKSDAIVLWVYTFGTRKGDIIRFKFDGPQGVVFEHETRLDKTQALAFRAAGKRRTIDAWPEGAYAGVASLWRKGQKIGAKTVNITLGLKP